MALFKYSDLRSNTSNHSIRAFDSLYENSLFKSADEININENDSFDIFLSHSYQDKEIIPNLKIELEKLGYKVYVDWINDKLLSREDVSPQTAKILQKRMNQSKSLLFATSENSPNSKWMPWELGYFDALKDKRVAILPLKKDNNDFKDSFKGQEYLGLYFWVDKAKIRNTNIYDLYINDNNDNYVIFTDWLYGKKPHHKK